MRHYAAKRPQWADKDRRMTLAAAQRDAGKSLRQIARALGVGHQTIIRDLRRFDATRNVVHFPGPNHPRAGQNGPPSAGQNGPGFGRYTGTRAQADMQARLQGRSS